MRGKHPARADGEYFAKKVLRNDKNAQPKTQKTSCKLSILRACFNLFNKLKQTYRLVSSIATSLFICKHAMYA